MRLDGSRPRQADAGQSKAGLGNHEQFVLLQKAEAAVKRAYGW